MLGLHSRCFPKFKQVNSFLTLVCFYADYPYKFVKVLKSQQIVEKENITLLCELDDAGGDVKWFKGEEEIKPDKRLDIYYF